MDVRTLPMGDCAVLAEVDGVPEALVLARALTDLWQMQEGVWRQVEDVLPATRTVLVTSRPGTDLGELARAVASTAREAVVGQEGAGELEVVEIEVRYDGPDLAEVARLTGLAQSEVVAAHVDTPWTVGFAGFAPGFAYLVGGDPRLRVARRHEPRTSVPAGSVGLAGEFSGIYPRESPGGWQLIGTTHAALWDVDRDPPALLRPGVRVQFVQVRS